ncbi:MAG TPA: sugar phosphate isomerase/epimerase, partial [Gemmatales bacterium]|nr:sugar phosphate isomerase/epimerase [Gemmatales bacterium]
MHRRTFLSSSLLALAGSQCHRLVLGQENPSTIKLGLQTYTFRNFNLERTLQFMQKLGLRYAEFFSKHIPAESTPDQLGTILKLCREYEVQPYSFGVVKFTKNHEANRRLFEFGKALGLSTMSCDPDPDSFDSLDKLCEEYRLPVGIHPHGPMGGKMHRWYSAQIIM